MQAGDDFLPAHWRAKHHVHHVFIGLVHDALKAVVLLHLLGRLNGIESDDIAPIVKTVSKCIIDGFNRTIGSHVNSVEIVVGKIKVEELLSQQWDAEGSSPGVSCHGVFGLATFWVGSVCLTCLGVLRCWLVVSFEFVRGWAIVQL